jgi:hypothetical protein
MQWTHGPQRITEAAMEVVVGVNRHGLSLRSRFGYAANEFCQCLGRHHSNAMGCAASDEFDGTSNRHCALELLVETEERVFR